MFKQTKASGYLAGGDAEIFSQETEWLGGILKRSIKGTVPFVIA
jgi:hypothetical protein